MNSASNLYLTSISIQQFAPYHKMDRILYSEVGGPTKAPLLSTKWYYSYPNLFQVNISNKIFFQVCILYKILAKISFTCSDLLWSSFHFHIVSEKNVYADICQGHIQGAFLTGSTKKCLRMAKSLPKKLKWRNPTGRCEVLTLTFFFLVRILPSPNTQNFLVGPVKKSTLYNTYQLVVVINDVKKTSSLCFCYLGGEAVDSG